MEFIYRNLTALLIFLTLAAFSWLWGGARPGPLLGVMPWAWAFALEALFFLPQRRPYEDAVAARQRVWHALGHDPLTWLSIAFMGLLTIQYFNRGLCPVCDYPAILAGADPAPAIPFFPFCVNASEQYGVMLWFIPSLTAMLAAKHALTRSGKRALVEMIMWNGAALALLGFIQQGTGAKFPFWTEPKGTLVHFFSVFGYPNMAGSFFMFIFALSVGLWNVRLREVAAIPQGHKHSQSTHEVKHHLWLRANYPLVPAILSFFAVLQSLCRAGIIIVFVLTALAIVYTVLGALTKRNRARAIRLSVVALIGFFLFLVSVSVFAPKDLGTELGTVGSFELLDRVTGKSQYHQRVATAIFKEYPFFGVGGWGYKHFCLQYMTDEETKQLQTTGGANVHNDHMQFLVEHGAVGEGLLILILCALVWPVVRDWRRLYRLACFSKSQDAPAKPKAVFAIPPPVFWTMAGATGVMIHAFGDCPLRSAAVLSTVLVSLACMEGFVPHFDED